MTFTVPLLLKPALPMPPSTLKISTTALFLLNVPLLLNMLTPELFTASELVLVPLMFQVPSLLITPPLLKSTLPGPFIVTTPLALLFQVRERKMSPLTVVGPFVTNAPVPCRNPPIRLLPPVTVTVPLPPSVPLRNVKGLAIVRLVLTLKAPKKPASIVTLPLVPRPKTVPL